VREATNASTRMHPITPTRSQGLPLMRPRERATFANPSTPSRREARPSPLSL
jgi:hypothetical protein